MSLLVALFHTLYGYSKCKGKNLYPLLSYKPDQCGTVCYSEDSVKPMPYKADEETDNKRHKL